MDAKQYNQAFIASLEPELQEVCQFLLEWFGGGLSHTYLNLAGTMGFLKHKDPSRQESARKSLVRIAAMLREDSLPALITGLQDSDWLMCEVAATAVKRKGPAAAEAIPALVNLLTLAGGFGRYAESGVAWRAVEALQAIGSAAVPSLIPFLTPEEHPVPRIMAVRALNGMGPEAIGAGPELVELIRKYAR